MTDLTVPNPGDITRRGVAVPAIVAAGGEETVNRFLEFFVASIRNNNNRRVYAAAVSRFRAWTEGIVLWKLPSDAARTYCQLLHRERTAKARLCVRLDIISTPIPRQWSLKRREHVL